ncbi:MAG: CHAT domain-containing protein [Cyanobacteria bacterium P01_F01_bin.86]
MYSLLHRLLSFRPLKALFLSSLVLTLLLGHPFQPFRNTSALAQDPNPSELVQDGVDAYNQGDYTAAIATWNQALDIYPPAALPERALVNENLARTYQHIGDTQAAIAAWEVAAAAYEQSDNTVQYGRMLTEQAQIYSNRGQHQRAAALLCGAEPQIIDADANADINPIVQCAGGSFAIANETDDAAGQVAALGSLAETYRLRGAYDFSRTLLLVGLQLIQAQDLPQYEAPLLISLGNTDARLSQVAARRAMAADLLNKRNLAEELRTEAAATREEALVSFNRALEVAAQQSAPLTEVRSHLSLLALYQSLDQANGINTSQQQLGQLINQLPPSRETAYAAITLAKSYQANSSFDCQDYSVSPQVNTWLETGHHIARQIADHRADSFALGELGHQQECQGHLAVAAALTNQAQLAASEALESADSLYLWEWQIGRIYRKQNEPAKALAAYAKSIATLESIRTDILTADRELQFDFRDTVDPVYRQYIELQLAMLPESTAVNKQVTAQVTAIEPPDIATTLETVDSLRLAELQNFFGNDCVLVSSEGARDRLLRENTQTAVISSIVLSNRTAIIASLPDGTAKTIWIDDSAALEQTTKDFRRGLKRFRNLAPYDKSLAQRLYNQLIGEFEADFRAANINTLVFVQDGFLRNIPMAALHDGEQYLIQRYAIATTPSLSLTAPGTAPSSELQVLAVGLSQATVTESGLEFGALDFVPAELESVVNQLPGSKTLLDENFTVEQLRTALQEDRYPILHLATHGQFSTIPEDTFVVTGATDAGVSGELTFGQLEALIREASPTAEPLDLITLTACETATGDDRATLGLAGVAIRAGARSAIASLWQVNDETAAQLVDNFYKHLKDPGVSKAQALQAAQIDAINEADATQNPGYWAPLILVGNWQ